MKPQLLLVLGSKNYSSWSLRPWLFLRKLGIGFQERIIHFDAADYRAQIAALSPSRRVPVLIDGGLVVWDSLAICEYAADLADRGLPDDREARAVARAVAAEMHSGFQTLRGDCPMNVRALGKRVAQTAPLLADIARIDAIWTECRDRFGDGGSWLFGAFSIADTMFAPIAFRFRTYGAALSGASSDYLAHLLADPHIGEWREAAEREGHPLPETDRLGAAAG
ncbi:MAG TPA: glutathione S-transferase family protein [Steroidobacteraceae bacterium]|nr:glutathione S-transferase family protein [Steroidobacteraceae bacterium]